MDAYDFHGSLLLALRPHGLKRTQATVWEFRCVKHQPDRDPSAWIGEYRWGCRVCGFEEPLDTLAEILHVEKLSRHGFTVEEYAERKGFTLSTLARWGVKTVQGQYGQVVEIPYLAPDGAVLRAKHRGQAKTWWGPGQGTYLYGLNILAQALPTLPVILVEGESDCHACWHKGVVAVGVPGATAWKPEWASQVQGRELFVWQEPGEAGAKFVASIAHSFPDVKVLSHPTAKDLADLFKAEGKRFALAVTDLLTAARPASHAPPTIHFDLAAGPKLQEVLQRKLAPIRAIATPLPSWSAACRDEGGGVGIARGWHVTIAARTGAGKSLFALNIGAHAVARGERVCFVSLEMSDIQLITRYLSILSGEPISVLEQGHRFNPVAYGRAERVANDIHRDTGAGMYVNAVPMSKLSDIETAIRYQVEVHGCGMVITDYMQLARTVSRKDPLDVVTEVSGTLRLLAKELGFAGVALSQFNRETSKDAEHPPTVNGLMGGSPLENDSDQVLLFDHTSYQRAEDGSTAQTKLLLAKNRHGPPKEIPFQWDYGTLRGAEVEKVLPPAPYSPGDAPEKEDPEDRGEAYEPGELELPRSALEFAYGD